MDRLKPTYRIVALCLALLMLVTSAGLSLDIHFCQEQIRSVSVFGAAKGCNGKDSARMSCAHRDLVDDQQPVLGKGKCCDNRKYLIQSHQNQVLPAMANADDVQHQVFALNPSSVMRPNVAIVRSIMIDRYRPPPLIRDIPVLVQSFLL
jgi:hypothetical protein